MKLRNILVAASTTLALSAGMVHAADVITVTGGTVHFRGSLVAAPCSVNANSADQVVTLGEYTLHQFKAKGDKTSLLPFKIILEDCDTSIAQTAAVAFSGQQDSADNGLLAIDSSSMGNTTTASGVGIQILDETSTAVKPDGTQFSSAHKLIDGQNTLNFSARYVSTVDKPTAGQANADATFIMKYE